MLIKVEVYFDKLKCPQLLPDSLFFATGLLFLSAHLHTLKIRGIRIEKKHFTIKMYKIKPIVEIWPELNNLPANMYNMKSVVNLQLEEGLHPDVSV